MEVPPNEPKKPMQPELRESVVQQLRAALDEKRGSLPDDVVTEIHNMLMNAEVPEEDADADESYRAATQRVVESGILSKDELEELVRNCEAEFK